MGGKWRSSLGLLLAVVHLSYQVSVEDSYTAAVVELQPTYIHNNADATLEANTNLFAEFIRNASIQGADIIVFPEYGLTSVSMPRRADIETWVSVIPSASEEYVPCTGQRSDVSKAIRKLSCAAKENRIYVLANVAEKEVCNQKNNECPSLGTFYYNTNVVFDRRGKIIARYRKVNLFMESDLYDTPKTPQIVTFDTDFGVTFGTFICFDILFRTPSLNLTRENKIKNFVYPVAWDSETPFLMAVQVHSGWAYSENVNLLASGFHNPRHGSTGSGIYLGRSGVAKATFSEFPKHKLLIARVPKIPKEVSDDNEVPMEIQPKMKKTIKSSDPWLVENSDVPYNTHGIRVTYNGISVQLDYIPVFASIPIRNSLKSTLCHGPFCCNFDVQTASNDQSSLYRAVAFQGTRLFGLQVKAGIRACGVVQCSDDSITSCGSANQDDTVFEKLEITTMLDEPEVLALPTALDTTLLPFENWTYSTQTVGTQKALRLKLDSPMKNVVNLGIYMRDFKKDKWRN
ncbi:vanin-like protein 1 [Calliopsis andreniformis]|uniref:vanin-like protein 1 n=1 Tax=Calliopsis andreniformis TaxID=337506 RepID=UPI003FCE7135